MKDARTGVLHPPPPAAPSAHVHSASFHANGTPIISPPSHFRSRRAGGTGWHTSAGGEPKQKHPPSRRRPHGFAAPYRAQFTPNLHPPTVEEVHRERRGAAAPGLPLHARGTHSCPETSPPQCHKLCPRTCVPLWVRLVVHQAQNECPLKLVSSPTHQWVKGGNDGILTLSSTTPSMPGGGE